MNKKHMKRTIMVCLCILFITSGLIYGEQLISIKIDGKSVVTESSPEIIDGRTFVPLRVIAEYFGADVQWTHETRTVEITSPGQQFLDEYGEKGMYVKNVEEVFTLVNEGKAIILDVRSTALRDISYITNSIHIPIEELLERTHEIPTDTIIAVYCAKNINASYAVAILNMNGIDAYLLENGMKVWEDIGGDITICRR